MNEPSISKILERVIEIAKANNDHELERWASLEFEGYISTNKYFLEETVVPKYREVTGEHRDIYGRPLLVSDPKISFINSIKLPDSVPFLESLSKKSDKLLSFKDPKICEMLNKNTLGGEVCEFVFHSAAIDGVLNSIKQEAIRRAEKYVSRRELMASETKPISQETNLPQNITLAWLWKNVPFRGWVTIISLLLGAFSAGLYISGIPQVKNVLRYIPGYNANLILSAETAENIEKQVAELVKAHNLRLSELQKALLDQERKGADKTFILDRKPHEESAQRIREMIQEENQSFQNELKFLKSTFK